MKPEAASAARASSPPQQDQFAEEEVEEQEEDPLTPLLTPTPTHPHRAPNPRAHDPYFGIRLADAALILLAYALPTEASELAQYAVDLLGARFWRAWVRRQAAFPVESIVHALPWSVFVLQEVCMHLGKFDEGRADELRELVWEWQEGRGVVPGNRAVGACDFGNRGKY